MGQKESKKFEGEWDHVDIPRATMANAKESPSHANWPAALKANQDILSEEESLAASLLISMGQEHLFENWDLPGFHDDRKHSFFLQINELSLNYLPEEGGLIAYINNARSLLSSSKNGVNPLEGWKPEIPTGTFLDPLTPEYDRFEKLGLTEVGKCGFVLVAGGLGERLGYDGIKISLPTETLTNTSYIELYCQQILAIQQRYGRHLVKGEGEGGGEWGVGRVHGVDSSEVKITVHQEGETEANALDIPLAIMVSEDTEALTRDLLHRNSFFGLKVGGETCSPYYLLFVRSSSSVVELVVLDVMAILGIFNG